MMSIDKPTMSDIIDGVKKSTQSSVKLPIFEPIGLIIELEGKFYGGIPAGQTVFISANTSKDRTQIPPAVTMTGQRGTTPVFIIDSMSEYKSETNDRGFMRSCSILDNYAYRFIEDLTEQKKLEKRLKANEKVLRKHPARKDLFLENRTLRERIKELKRKDK